MRHLTSWAALVVLSAAAVATGRVVPALLLAAVKVGLIGLDFMELRWADARLRFGFLGATALGVGLVAWLAHG